MSIPIKEASIVDFRRKIKEDEITPKECVENLCDRIDKFDDELRSFVDEPDRRRRLHEEIDDVQSKSPDSGDRPPLFGIPVGIKDIIHADDLETRAGTAVPPELFAGPEATCVSRLRDAGALVLGKTVTTEFAGSAPGLTRNPHNLDHTPGGSSSGSAAAVAAGLCPLALGTQTGGSVIRPAAFCGIVGMKPSFKRIPRDGVIERSVSADHVGM
jgi:Asp-tRNA(Asn)/Glu-tRNA(Gln) amidotransferase A subunit family amidase